MHEFQFNFDKKPEKKLPEKGLLECWLPIENNPQMLPKEKDAVYFGDAVDSLYIVKPAFLHSDSENGLAFMPADELEYYFLLAKLAKSPYMVLLKEQKKDAHMKKHLLERHTISDMNTFYLDHFNGPGFGGLSTSDTLFEKKTISYLPDTMVLFRKVA